MINNIIADITRLLILVAVCAVGIELQDINKSTHEASVTLEKIRSSMQ